MRIYSMVELIAGVSKETDLQRTHINYMVRDKGEEKDCNDHALCRSCECPGNLECGHKHLNPDHNCTLDEYGTCPCCNDIGDNVPQERQVFIPFDNPAQLKLDFDGVRDEQQHKEV